MFMNNRFNDGSTFLANFATHFFVHCPHCQKMATVAVSSNEIVRMSCLNCVFFQSWSGTLAGVHMIANHAGSYQAGDIVVGANTDWYFHFPLWLKAACCGEELWAYNAEHLFWLKSYIGASLRERQKNQQTGWYNAGLSSRLLKWLKLSKNRNEILKTIECLEKKI